MKNISSSFRLDINGLRAIAVIAVVLFHFNSSWLPGGFAGVDVFFVISGFLMARIFNGKVDQGISGVFSFYKSRLLRIYPALLSMITLGYAFLTIAGSKGWMLDFYNESKYALFFISNYFYNTHSEYFDVAANNRWLLHTWSLSVEWQFYLIYPLLVLAATRLLGNKFLFIVYFILLSTSLFVCFFIFNNDQNSAFYSLSSRAWELFLGSIISLIRFNSAPKFRRVLELTGVVMIVASIAMFSSAGWPNIFTTIPVIGAAMVIVANVGNDNSILRFSPFQRLGDISYSLYLWHWVAVAYMHNADIVFDIENIIKAIILSIGMAIVSYNYLERWSNRKVTYVASAAVIAFIGLFVSNLAVSESASRISYFSAYANTDGFDKQFTRKCFITSRTKKFEEYAKDKCLSTSPTKKNVLLIGDSHAAQLSESLRNELKEYNVMQATASGCMPFKGVKTPGFCSKLINYIYDDFIEKNKVDVVILTAFWTLGVSDNISALTASVAALKATGAKVIIIGQTKSFRKPFYQIALQVPEGDLHNFYDMKTQKFHESISPEIKKIPDRYVNGYDINANVFFDKKGNPLFFDDNHLTPYGASMLSSSVADATRAIIN